MRNQIPLRSPTVSTLIGCRERDRRSQLGLLTQRPSGSLVYSWFLGFSWTCMESIYHSNSYSISCIVWNSKAHFLQQNSLQTRKPIPNSQPHLICWRCKSSIAVKGIIRSVVPSPVIEVVNVSILVHLMEVDSGAESWQYSASNNFVPKTIGHTVTE